MGSKKFLGQVMTSEGAFFKELKKCSSFDQVKEMSSRVLKYLKDDLNFLGGQFRKTCDLFEKLFQQSSTI